MDTDVIMMVAAASLGLSASGAFFTSRFFIGFLVPVCSLLACAIYVAVHQGGWDLHGFATVLVWAVIGLIEVGPSALAASALGALVGRALSRKWGRRSRVPT